MAEKQDCIEELIFGGKRIEKITLLRCTSEEMNGIVEIMFQDVISIADLNMTPKKLSKYVLAYLKFQGMNDDRDKMINTILVKDKEVEEKIFQNYKGEFMKYLS